MACSFVGLAGFSAVSGLLAQEKSGAKPEPDVLIFMDGEKLIGHLESSTGSTVKFKSDMAGEVTVAWKKVKELHTSEKFAVIPKNVKLRRKGETPNIPQGTVTATNQKVEVSPAAGQPSRTVPLGDTAYIVDEPSFQNAMEYSPNLFEDWRGAITAGASLVEATQNSRTFTGALNLVRAIPSENWLNPRNRTAVDLTVSYGEVTQPNTPALLTSIYHADAERDEYFTGSPVFAFLEAAFDHNYSQGLDLEQMYGGGIGWTVIKNAAEVLDLKGSMTYINQQFATSAENQSLIGSVFSEHYNRKLRRSMVFDEQLSVAPAWNNTNAYSATGGATLAMPVFKRLSLSFATLDTFLNNPSPGFKKNSFQTTLGVTYTLQ
ncbi:MAG TPA: DUF481 domain-containing protein [Bryobacteraceae bacterium]|nr:DUF481 domain-containing protein [Bryobacteraceae bacterium]